MDELNIKVNGIDVSATFNPETKTYTATIPFEIEGNLVLSYE